MIMDKKVVHSLVGRGPSLNRYVLSSSNFRGGVWEHPDILKKKGKKGMVVQMNKISTVYMTSIVRLNKYLLNLTCALRLIHINTISHHISVIIILFFINTTCIY